MTRSGSEAAGEPGAGAAPSRLARWWLHATGIDARSLGLYRIGVAAVLLCDLASRAADLRAHYGDWGVLPRWAVATWLGRGAWLSPYMWHGDAWWAALVMLATAAAAVGLLVGWRPRTMAALCFVLVAGLHARNPAVVHSGDNLLRVLLFWTPWLPLPGAWAIGGARGVAGGGGERLLVSPAVLGIRVQLCLVYWVSGLLKLNTDWLGDRDAILTALFDDQLVTSWGKVLRRFPAALRLLAPATVALELVGPLLVWVRRGGGPLRTGVVLAFVGFHLAGLGPALALGTFPWVCAVAWALFLPGWFWGRVRWGGVGVGVEERGKVRGAHPTGGAVGVGVTGDDGAGVGVARRRAGVAAVAVVVAGLLAMAAAEVWPGRVRLPAAVVLPATLLGIHQRWNMFVRPPRDDGWLIAAGRLADTRVVDVWRRSDGPGGPVPVDARKPESVAASFGGSRWIKYLSQLNDPGYVHHRRLFAGYLCRRWNDAHSGNARLVGLQLYFVLEPTLPGGGDGEPRPLLIWQQQCP